MKAIETRYAGATDNRGARMIASDLDGNRISIPYPYGLANAEETHRAAADALCQKMGWTGTLVAGATKRGYAFVFVNEVPTDV